MFHGSLFAAQLGLIKAPPICDGFERVFAAVLTVLTPAALLTFLLPEISRGGVIGKARDGIPALSTQMATQAHCQFFRSWMGVFALTPEYQGTQWAVPYSVARQSP